MKKLIIKIKNLLSIQGTYSWAIKQMKEGAFIKSDKLKTGYSLFYDYECNSLMLAKGYMNQKIEDCIFAEEKVYKLLLIEDFYVTTLKRNVLVKTNFIRNTNFSWIVYYNLTNEAFVN